MSNYLLVRFENDLCKMGEDLWGVDGPEDFFDRVLERVSQLKAQLKVQRSLQATAKLLRGQPDNKALPKQQATKVRNMMRFVFRHSGEQREEGIQGRHKQLRDLDCDALKICGLSYTTAEIVGLDGVEFEILQKRAEDFTHRRGLSSLLYRPDVDKAVDSKLDDPEDEHAFEKFMQSHTSRRLSMRKRKYRETTPPDEVAHGEPTKATENPESVKFGDVFTLNIEDAQWALSCEQPTTPIFLTIPKPVHGMESQSSFITIWISEGVGRLLSQRGTEAIYPL